MWDTLRDNGAPKRNGGRVIGRSARAASYYPISIPHHGLPEGHEPRSPPAPEAGTKPDNFVDAHIEDGRYRGFAYCFDPSAYDPSTKFSQRIDGEFVQQKAAGTQLSFGLIFDEDRYFYLSSKNSPRLDQRRRLMPTDNSDLQIAAALCEQV